ncbi:MAG TPA: transporter [Geothermobacteraceae bacterium]|nr:transporter [Geothermobacteraceae bacterium]
MPLARFVSVLLAALFITLPTCGFATSLIDQSEPAPLNLSLGLGMQFEAGDYGTSDTVEIWKVPLLVEWAPQERLMLALEIPYLYQSRTGATVLVGGTPTPVRRGTGSMAGTGGMSVVGSESSVSGLGDITLTASLTLLKDQEAMPRILAHLYAKLPTADEQEGLGTGEFDWGGGLGLGKRFGDWSSYAEALYIEPGTSELYAPDGYWEWLASLSYRTTANLRPGLSISGGTAPFAGTEGPLELKARLTGLSGELTSYSFYVVRGLSDASPDWGLGCSIYFDL